ncbi:ROK family transcriptional regulator [Actinomyces faecalis]|uniref:ROK family transcriptional regulator n=1 Tax=Actinomyces faecalis TaxID=2722820 RepID=UPI00155271DF|nr:ROK family transcriptional regulator [Actinomyces faecalis]
MVRSTSQTTASAAARARRSPARAGATRGARTTASARQSTLRTANLALVARQVLSSPTPISRADVAAATGMTRSTASRLVDELVGTGILVELDPAPSSGPGRPAVPLAPPHATFVALGLEVNVAHMAVRAIDLSGELLTERVVLDDFSDSDPAVVLRRLAALVADVLALPTIRAARLVGAGIALPGLVSDGVLLRAPNLGWSGVRPADHLASVLDGNRLSLEVGNEASLGALTVGRSRPVLAPQWPSFIYLSGENGIGAGIVRDGQALAGTNGFAGEIGHVQVDPSGPLCTCGNTGCLERYAGRRSILTAAGLTEDTRPEELVAAWQAGDVGARQAISAAAHALGVSLGAAVNLLDIPVVVLGGHLAPLAEVLRSEVEEELGKRVLASQWTELEILQAGSDQMPGATGAAWSLLETVVADPSAWM